MGRLFICTFIILSSFWELVFAQNDLESTIHVIDSSNFIVLYELNFKQDTTNLDYIISETMYLFIGSSHSMFISKNLFIYFGLIKEIKSQESFSSWLSNPNNKPPKPKVLYQIIKDFTTGEILYFERIIGTSFKYQEEIYSLHWKLQNISDTILGYHVQQATLEYGGRSWFAWFCPEIPYNDGPYKFCGLPGLILKVYDSDMHYVFEVESIEQVAEYVNFELPEIDYVKTSRHGFLKSKENFRSDIINRAKEAGLSSEAQQTAARNLQKKNNPIELR